MHMLDEYYYIIDIKNLTNNILISFINRTTNKHSLFIDEDVTFILTRWPVD